MPMSTMAEFMRDLETALTSSLRGIVDIASSDSESEEKRSDLAVAS